MNPIAGGARNHYELLEVSPSASPEVLRAAYKSLIQRYHPDRNPGDASAAERSSLLIKAYQVLSDPAARAVYDLELQQQADRLARLSSRRRDPPAATRSSGNNYQWLFWAPVVLLALFLWLFWTAFFNAPPVNTVAAAKTIASPHDVPPHSDEKASLAARTLGEFITNLNVTLAPRGGPVNVADRPLHVLSIKTIGVVAGGSDTEKYLALLSSSQEYVAGKLAARLANVDDERLRKDDGDRYLKQLILDALSEITNTRRFELAAAGRSAATHYGAVDILLPEAFAVEARPPDQGTGQSPAPR